ncbi:RNA polymerase sigma factor [Rufibacter psychrotolerans]|uniref:RNA polymerase sigma factor n=1 Tax=Rufibacter psychrotolerans TaxID=2812556 RepID=UPI001967A0E0|nr:RNA polymerase sigma-70 factor [Rufibacter sp. SYSU D00308]
MGRLAQIDEQTLLQQIRRGDDEAFDELYNRYWKKLYAAAIKKVGCKEDAMDLVQDLFVEFWNKRDKVLITSSLSTYLISSLYYKAFHHFRSKGVQDKHIRIFQEFTQQSTQQEYAPGSVSQHEFEVEFEQLQVIINQAIQEMPEKMRNVFQMMRSGERSVAEVAVALNISPQTVKNQTGTAMQRLRKAVQEHAYELPVSMLLILVFNK